MIDHDSIRLLEQSLAQLDQLAGAGALRWQQAEGRDEAGVVTATVTADLRLAAVVVAGGWRSSLAPKDLGGAVLAAVGDALLRCCAGLEAADPASVAAPVVAPAYAERAEAMVTAARQRIEADLAAMTDLDAGIERVHQALDEFQKLPAADPERIEYASANRRVVLVYEGGLPVEVHFDQGWLKTQSGTSLSMVLAEVLAQAEGSR